MCTVIIHVPPAAADGASGAVRLLAVRDEDPDRAWDPFGPWWPETHPGVSGVRDRRAGGAWLAASDDRVAVLLNRADDSTRPESEMLSRGGVVLEAAEGRMPHGDPRTHGFHLVVAEATGARVVTWDGVRLRETVLDPGTHMLAHDDIDDRSTARIDAWLDDFRAAPLGDGSSGDGSSGDGSSGDGSSGDGWERPWLDVLAAGADLPGADDRAIIRDNRPFGYPTQSLLLCAASVSASGTDVRYGEFERPGRWNRPHLH